MRENRFVYSGEITPIKGGSMRVTILDFVIDGLEAVDRDLFPGMDVSVSGSHVILTYVDTPVYRRIAVLGIAMHAQDTSVSLLHKRSMVLSRQVAIVREENFHLPTYERQIEWARHNRVIAAEELEQMRSLLSIQEDILSKEIS